MRIVIISPLCLPVPAVRGGAIETIIQLIFDENERVEGNTEILVISEYDPKAFELSKYYKKTRFYWIHNNTIWHRIYNFPIRAMHRLFGLNLDRLDAVLIKRVIQRGDFDKIVVEGNTLHAFALTKKYDKGRLYFHLHADILNNDTPLNRSIVTGCHKIIVVSEFIKRRVLNLPQATAGQIRVLMNCIDLSCFGIEVDDSKKNLLRSQYGIAPDVVVILFAGRIVAQKGILELIEALKRMPRNCQYKLIVAGSFGSGFGSSDGDRDFQAKVYEISASIKDRIVFTGFIHNRQMHLLHSISHIAVAPSICEEAAGLVAIEAMASGLPLVVTNSGGLPEYVNTDCAIIIDHGEHMVINLANAIETMISDSELRQRMGSAGRNHSLQYSQHSYYKQFINLLGEK